MSQVTDQMSSLWPALAFLLAGVPLAELLERVGFFDAVVAVVCGRDGRDTSVLVLWLLAALTTVVLNLDTTVVLLTPLYFRLARRAGHDPLPIVAIPLLLASLASSVLPVSNLTNLIFVEHFDVGVGDFVARLALPSAAATSVGWLVYRRRHPLRLTVPGGGAVDLRALTIGSAVVAFLLVGFIIGPSLGVDPWITAAVADIVLVAVTRFVPWRSVPLITALGVAALGAFVALVVPSERLGELLTRADGPGAVGLATIVAAGAANLVNNLPALLVGAGGSDQLSWGVWAWLLGVNVGAVLMPIGALANLLWLRVVRDEGQVVDLRRYLRLVVPIALPALLTAAGVLAIESALVGR